jgi:hypothetical protein
MALRQTDVVRRRVCSGIAAALVFGVLVVYVVLITSQDENTEDGPFWMVVAGVITVLALLLVAGALLSSRVVARAVLIAALVLESLGMLAGAFSIGILFVPSLVLTIVALVDTAQPVTSGPAASP